MSDSTGKDFTPTIHHTPYPSINPDNVILPKPFVVCITGASRDVGAHIAYAYARAGCTCIAVCSPTETEVSASQIPSELSRINPSIKSLNRFAM